MCLNCKETKRCLKCGKLKEKADFSAAAWRTRNLCRHTCKTCSSKERGSWTCASCVTSQPKRLFARYLRRRGAQHGDQTYDKCLAKRDLKQTAEVKRDSQEHRQNENKDPSRDLASGHQAAGAAAAIATKKRMAIRDRPQLQEHAFIITTTILRSCFQKPGHTG